MNRIQKRRDIPQAHFSRPFKVPVAKHWDATASLGRKDDLETISLEDFNRGLSYIDLIRIGVTAIEIANFFISFRTVFPKPLPEGGGLIAREIPSSIDFKEGF